VVVSLLFVLLLKGHCTSESQSLCRSWCVADLQHCTVLYSTVLYVLVYVSLQVVNVLASAGALDMDSQVLMPLGEIAARLRGTNELCDRDGPLPTPPSPPSPPPAGGRVRHPGGRGPQGAREQ